MYFAPTATWRIAPGTALTLLGYYQYDDNDGGQGGFLPVVGTLLPGPAGQISQRTNLQDPRNEFKRRQFRRRLRVHPSLRPVGRLPLGGALEPVSASAARSSCIAGFIIDNRTIGQYNFPFAEDVHSFTSDNRINAHVTTGPVRHNLLVGVDYRTQHNVAAFGFAGAGSLDVYHPVYSTPDTGLDIGYPVPYNNQRLRQTGVYGQEQAAIGQLFLTLGGRYDWVSERFVSGATTTGRTSTPSPGAPVPTT